MSRRPETDEYLASLMPESCIWKYFWLGGEKKYETSCGQHYPEKMHGNYCKNCGKPITEMPNDTSTPV